MDVIHALRCKAQHLCLGLTGEVITTPFTFASTTHAIVRNGCMPVFCDINPDDYTIDVSKIESLITDKTSAIVPVHVYGNICDVEEIERIANKYGLKVIYDAAHTFGEEYKGRGVGSFGDVSCFSFHATKVFNTTFDCFHGMYDVNSKKRKKVITMPRTKGSKNRPKTTTNSVSKTDYASQITEKQSEITTLTTEITSIQKQIEENKATLKDKRAALKKAEKELSKLEAKKTAADQKAAEEAKKAEAESVVKKLIDSGMSVDEIIEKLK